ncbi:MAG: sigma-70 family RNA polymerase sigma factor [Planctomycetota bacterium]
MPDGPPPADPCALERELEGALPRLRAHVARRGGAGATEDVAQEAAARALRYRAGYDPARGLWPWLRRLADRVLVDHRRSEARAPVAADDLDPAAPDVTAPLDEADAVARVVAGLPAAEREALLQFHVEGRSVEAIAAARGVPVGTVKSQLSRARRRLAGWKGDGDDE